MSYETNEDTLPLYATHSPSSLMPLSYDEATGNLFSYIDSDRSKLSALLQQASTTLPSFTVILAGHFCYPSSPDFIFSIHNPAAVAAGLGLEKGIIPRGYAYVDQLEGTKGLHTKRVLLKRPGSSSTTKAPRDEEAGPMQSDGWKFTAYGDMRDWDAERKKFNRRGLPGFVHPDSLADITKVDGSATTPAGTLLFQYPLPNKTDWGRISHPQSSITSDQSSVEKALQEYSSNRNIFKKLTITPEVYGWDFQLLKASIVSIIRRSEYTGRVSVDFRTSPKSIIIRPDTKLSRVFGYSFWTKILLWLCLVYPLILILELAVGIRYKVHVAFPLTRWQVLPIPTSDDSSATSSPRAPLSVSEATALAHPLSSRRTPKVAQLPDAQKTWIYFTGSQEAEWLATWSKQIVEEVKRKRRERNLIEGVEFVDLLTKLTTLSLC